LEGAPLILFVFDDDFAAAIKLNAPDDLEVERLGPIRCDIVSSDGGRQPSALRIGSVNSGRRNLIQGVGENVANHPHHAGIGVSGLIRLSDSFADGILPGPHPAGRGLADNGDRLGLTFIAEQPSGAQRDFHYIYTGDAWINLLRRNNFYLNQGFAINHGLELANGLFLYTNGAITFRRSLSDYETGTKIDELFPDTFDNDTAIAFDPYNAFYGSARLQYTPHQRYIREPKEKIIIGSKWPTFYVSWRKGIPGVFKSKVDFDYLEFGIEQELKLGVTGVSKVFL